MQSAAQLRGGGSELRHAVAEGLGYLLQTRRFDARDRCHNRHLADPMFFHVSEYTMKRSSRRPDRPIFWPISGGGSVVSDGHVGRGTHGEASPGVPTSLWLPSVIL